MQLLYRTPGSDSVIPYNTCYEVMGKARVIPFKNMWSPNESLLTTINKSTKVLGSVSACVCLVG